MFTQLYQLTAYLIRSGWKAYDIICVLPEPKNYCVIPIRPYGDKEDYETTTQTDC